MTSVEWKYLILALPLAWMLQFAFAYPQTVHVHRVLAGLRTRGHVGVGSRRGRLNPGALVAVAVDDSRRIVEAQALTGRTVFARFRPLPEVAGAPVDGPHLLAGRPRAVREAFAMAVRGVAADRSSRERQSDARARVGS